MTSEVDISAFGQDWLAAATTGGLPEPRHSRWQPLRVGIVSLWEYDDAEFWFADGRLVLRGGNGAGKTKVLELTTLMLLRGEIVPSVLDPFGSQHRTMRFNLLPTGEADDPREPADSGLGYAWVEFGRLDNGNPQFFVCGMGVSARRGSGTSPPTPWHFVTGLRPGKDLQLVVGGRAIEQKDLRKNDGVSVPGSAGAYRSRLAEELFDLSTASYDNLTELLKQLRRPKLGERLSPASLTQTLCDALPPVAGHEITQLAEGWEHLRQLQAAVEQTEDAARAVAQFVRNGWRPWARAVLRQRADEFASATTKLDDTTRDKRDAEKTLTDAREAVTDADTRLGSTRRDRADRGTELRTLLDSASYQDAVAAAQRVEGLRSEAKNLAKQVADAERRARDERQATEHAQKWLGQVEDDERAARDRIEAEGSALRAEASPAGLSASVEAHLPGLDIEALQSDQQDRTERFARLRSLHSDYETAERKAELSAQAMVNAEEALSSAGDDEANARLEIGRTVETFHQQIRDWAAAATAVSCPAELVEDWCDQVDELTLIDIETGSVGSRSSVVETMRNHVSRARQSLAHQAEQLRLQRAPLATRQEEVAAELAEMRSRTETVPPVPLSWARRERPGLEADLGAPLWRLVNPVEELEGEALALLEASLAASGLLDSWVSADGLLDTVDGRLLVDVQPAPASSVTGRGLLAVLQPDTAGGVDADVVRRVLSRIAWFESAPDQLDGDWLAADGTWGIGGLTGRAEPVGPASYVGASARAAARERAIARLESELEALDTRIAKLDGQLGEIDESVRALDGNERAIPEDTERALAGQVHTLAERSRRVRGCEDTLRRTRETHAADLALKDRTWAGFAEYAAEHSFRLRDLDEQRQAIQDYATRLGKVRAAADRLARLQPNLTEARRRRAEQQEKWSRAEEERAEYEEQLRQSKVRLATAEQAVGAEYAEQLRRREGLDEELERLDELITQLNTSVTNANIAVARAEAVLQTHETSRLEAEQRRDTALAALWEAVDAGLVEPVGIAQPERRAVQAAREFAAGVRREVVAGPQGPDVDRVWRRCYQGMEQLRQSILPNRDARVREEEAASGLQQVVVLVDPDHGWLPPHKAAEVLTERVTEQRQRFDAEQQRVLTTLLGSTFIEHLKERLDYTAHTIDDINKQLARHPTRHGHVVRVQWEADPRDPDASAVVSALSRGYRELSPERQETVRGFLRRRIDEARDAADSEGAADWKDQLAEALDYRGWLRLSLEYRQGTGGRWVAFDAAKHGAKSGGEKVVLLSQPLFAAAVVAYNAAGPNAPRWVWLDEAMTGVDAAVKASFMGLTVQFELDIMLTAHDEWCTYPTVPAVAVYDLARHPHIPGVDYLPYLWCGGQLSQVDIDRLGVRPDTSQVPAEGLFADPADGDDG